MDDPLRIGYLRCRSRNQSLDGIKSMAPSTCRIWPFNNGSQAVRKHQAPSVSPTPPGRRACRPACSGGRSGRGITVLLALKVVLVVVLLMIFVADHAAMWQSRYGSGGPNALSQKTERSGKRMHYAEVIRSCA